MITLAKLNVGVTGSFKIANNHIQCEVAKQFPKAIYTYSAFKTEKRNLKFQLKILNMFLCVCCGADISTYKNKILHSDYK